MGGSGGAVFAGWVLPYLSMYLLLPLPGLMATRREELWRYAIGLAVMLVVARRDFFFAYPVEYPRPTTPAGRARVYRVMVSVDRPANALPSLHAGLVVFTMLFAGRVMADWPVSWRRAAWRRAGSGPDPSRNAAPATLFRARRGGRCRGVIWCGGGRGGEDEGKVAGKGDRNAVVVE